MTDLGTIVRRDMDRVPVPDLTLERFHGRRLRQARNRRLAAGAVAAAIVVTGALAFVRVLLAEPVPADVGPPRVGMALPFGAVAYSALPGGDVADEPDPTGPADIYLSVPGGDPRRIVGADGDGLDQFCPTFSPDGSRLAYLEGTAPVAPDGPTTLLVVDLDAEGTTADPEELADIGEALVSCPQWSPDGRRLAVLRGGQELLIATPGAGSSTIELGSSADAEPPGGGGGFAWSPDATSLAVTDARKAWIVRVDAASGPEILFDEPDKQLEALAWSPDGERVAVGGAFGPSHEDDGPMLQIVSAGSGAIQEVDVDPELVGDVVSEITWLPDSNQLAVTADVPRSASGGTALMHPDSGSVTPLRPTYTVDASGGPLPTQAIRWSADERWFVYLAHDERRMDGYAVVAEPIDGSAPPVVLSPWTSSLATNGGDLTLRADIP